jgi:hypothetical protein
MADLERPQGYSPEEAAQVAADHAQSPDVESARPVTFAGSTHVHLDLTDGDIVVIGPDECLHIVW